MQDREQIQKEIDAVRLQISIVDTAATTAPDDEKERWKQKRVTLQTRLEALQRDLAACKSTEDNAVPVFDDAEADAMFNQIIYAADSSGSDSDSSVSAEPQQEQQPEVIYSDSSAEPDETDAMFDKFFSQADMAESEQASEEGEQTQPEQQSGEQDLLNSQDVIMADAPTTESTEPKSEISTEELYNDLQKALYGLDDIQPEQEQSASDNIQSAQEGEQSAPEGEAYAATAERDNGQETKQTQERLAQDSVETSAAPQSEVTHSEPEENLKLDITDSLREAINAAALSITANSEYSATGSNSDLAALRAEAEEANRKAQAALAEAERLREEAEKIKLQAETERAMYAAEMELQRGLRSREEAMREAAVKAERDKLNEKIARRKAEITQIRNGLQDVKDSDSAFVLREKLFAVQLVLDEDERNSPEISYLLTKSLDDLSHVLEVAELKRRIAAFVASAKKAAEARKAAAAKKAAAKKRAAKKAEAKKKKAVSKARRRPPIRGYARMYGRPPMRYYPAGRR